MWSITATNPVRIYRVGSKMDTIGTETAQVWYRLGPMSTSLAGWTQAGSAVTVTVTQTATATQVPIDLNLNINLK